jgi:3-hydroxyacyl-[acyl-carrier-protein] dehydratase
LLRSVEKRDDKLVLFTTIEEAKFRKPVVPGDQLRVEMQVLKRKATVCKMSGKATVDGRLVAEAILMCQLADRPAPTAASDGS